LWPPAASAHTSSDALPGEACCGAFGGLQGGLWTGWCFPSKLTKGYVTSSFLKMMFTAFGNKLKECNKNVKAPLTAMQAPSLGLL